METIEIKKNCGLPVLIKGIITGQDNNKRYEIYFEPLSIAKLDMTERIISKPIKLVNEIKISKLKTSPDKLRNSPIPNKYVA